MTSTRSSQFLFKSVDISSLVFFRIAFGIIGFADVIASFTYLHLHKGAFDPEAFQFKYYGFEWVQPLSDPWMSIFFILLLISSIGITLGKWYRLSALFFATGFIYIFLLEKAYYLNHGYLLCVLSFLIIFMPLHKSFSFDVLKSPEQQQSTVPYWSLFLLQLMMGIVYFYGGIAKINLDWLNGLPLKLWLKNRSDIFLIGPLVAQEWVAYFMSYSGLLLDLFVAFFLINRRTRIWALGFVLFFHATNFVLFQIGVFPFLSISLTLLFFPPDFPKKVSAFLLEKIPLLENIRYRIQEFLQKKYPAFYNYTPTNAIHDQSFQRKWIPPLLTVFILIQLLVPLRHHYFKGPVAWTEEGHRYSWRMMLRSKHGYGHFEVVNPVTCKTTRISPINYLSKRQKRKLFTHPDMVLQFAHFLRDTHQEEGQEPIEVYAFIKAKLNGRKYQAYINSQRNLAKEKWSFFEESDWIIPIEWDSK